MTEVKEHHMWVTWPPAVIHTVCEAFSKASFPGLRFPTCTARGLDVQSLCGNTAISSKDFFS